MDQSREEAVGMAERGSSWLATATGGEESSCNDQDTSKSERLDDIHEQNRIGDEPDNEHEEVEGQEICNAASGVSETQEYSTEEHAPEIIAHYKSEHSSYAGGISEYGPSCEIIGHAEDKIDRKSRGEDQDERGSGPRYEVESSDNPSHADIIYGYGTSNHLESGASDNNAWGAFLVVPDVKVLSETSSLDLEWEGHGQRSRALSHISLNTDGSSTVLDLVRDSSLVDPTDCLHKFQQNTDLALWPAGKWQCMDCKMILASRMCNLAFMLRQTKIAI